MERVELALVEDVGEDADLLAVVYVDQPDLVAVRAVDGSPAENTGRARDRLRRRWRNHVEPERIAPVGLRRLARVADGRPDARIERVRRAGDPRPRQRRGGAGARP